MVAAVFGEGFIRCLGNRIRKTALFPCTSRELGELSGLGELTVWFREELGHYAGVKLDGDTSSRLTVWFREGLGYYRILRESCQVPRAVNMRNTRRRIVMAILAVISVLPTWAVMP